LSRLVEEITGMDWWEAVDALLLTPLGVEPAFTVEPGGKRSARTFMAGHAVEAGRWSRRCRKSRPARRNWP